MSNWVLFSFVSFQFNNIILVARDIDYDVSILEHEITAARQEKSRRTLANKIAQDIAQVKAGQNNVPHFYRIRVGYHGNEYKILFTTLT